MIVFTVVFSVLMPNNNIEKYPIFLLCGLLAWNYFSSSVMSGTNCIVANGNLVKKVYFPREILPIATVLANLVNFLLALLVLFAVLLVFRATFSPWLWLLPVVILIQTGFTLGVVFFLSAIQVYYRDTLLMLDVLMLAWFFLTPVFYAVVFCRRRTQYSALRLMCSGWSIFSIRWHRSLTCTATCSIGDIEPTPTSSGEPRHGAADSLAGLLVFRPLQRQLRRRGLDPGAYQGSYSRVYTPSTLMRARIRSCAASSRRISHGAGATGPV